MQSANRTTISRLVLVGCMVALAVWVALGSLSPKGGGAPQDVAEVPANGSGQAQSQQLPQAEPTEEPPLPQITPTWTAVNPTPTIKAWDPPVPVTGITVSAMDQASQVTLAQKSAVNRADCISQIIWAPTGDKLLYLTLSGGLYWSNPDGSNATLLHQYSQDDYARLEAQTPMTNTLLITHPGLVQSDGQRAPGHMDVVRFTPGQPPTLEEGPNIAHLPNYIHWWSPDRVSGTSFAGYGGGNLLVTLDGNGNLVSEINVPHMVAGFVRPGGEWLAYMTDEREWVQMRDGTANGTVYLLNLNTGERRQVTEAGKAYGGIGNWSPDGNWFLTGTQLGVAVVSADGREWITIPNGRVDAVWSPNSRYLVFSEINGQGGDDQIGPTSWTGATYVVDVPQRKVITDQPSLSPKGSAAELMWQPRWSPNNSLITFLSFDPNRTFECSGRTPAFYQMTLP